MAPLADAFVRVRADTSGIRNDLRRDFGNAGGAAGGAFGAGFTRDATGRLRDSRGRFVTAGAAAGEAFGTGFTRDATGRLRDARGRFVIEGHQLGESTGDGFSAGFDSRVRGGSGIGDVVRRLFDLLTPRLSALAGGLGATVGVVGALTPRLSTLAGGFGAAAGAAGGLATGAARAGSVLGTVTLAAGGVIAQLGKLALAAGALATLAAGAASATSAVVALAAALAPAAGSLAALPGILALGAAGLGTMKLALLGVAEGFAAAISGDYLAFMEGTKDLSAAAGTVAYELFQMSGAFQGLRLAVQDAVFRPLVDQMWSLLPVVTALKHGMVGVAEQFGLGALELVRFARAGESVWAITSIFSSARDSVAAFVPALAPLLNGFRDLAVVSAGWLAGLAPGIAKAAEQFGRFMYHAAASGQALTWLNNALAVFKALGAIAADVGGIIGGVFAAAETAGTGALGIVGQLVDRLNVLINSDAGQAGLVTVFQSLFEIGQSLTPVLGALVGAAALLAPLFADIAAAFGPGLVGAVNALAPALAAVAPGLVLVGQALTSTFTDPAVQGGLLDIGRGLATLLGAVSPLVPLVASIAAGLAGALLPALTALAPGLQVVGAALAATFASATVRTGLLQLGIGLGQLLAAASPLIGILASLASSVLTALVPAVAAVMPGLVAVGTALAWAFANPVVSQALLSLGVGLANMLIAVSPLIPPLVQLAAILVERLGVSLSTLAALLAPVVVALAQVLAPVLPQLAAMFSQVSGAVLPLAEQIGAQLAESLRQLQPVLAPVIDALREVGQRVLAEILTVLPQVLPHMGSMAVAFSALFVEVAKVLPDLIRFAGEILVALIAQVPVLAPMIVELAFAFLDVFRQLTPLVPPLLRLLLEAVLPLIPALPQLLPPLTQLAYVFRDVLAWASPMIKKFLESPEALASIRSLATSGVTLLNLLKDGLGLTLGAIQTFLGVFFGVPGQVEAGLGRIAVAIKGWINSIIGWFESVTNNIADVFPGIPHISLPRLAQGAVVTRRMLAMIGEAGPEVVIPLTRPARAAQLARESGLLDILSSRMSGLTSALAVPPLALPAAGTLPGGTSGVGGRGGVGGGGVTVHGDLVVPVTGVLDPTRPDTIRALVVQLREFLRDLEREGYE